MSWCSYQDCVFSGVLAHAVCLVRGLVDACHYVFEGPANTRGHNGPGRESSQCPLDGLLNIAQLHPVPRHRCYSSPVNGGELGVEPVLVNSPRRHGVTQIGSMKISKALAYGLPMLPSFISCVQVWGPNMGIAMVLMELGSIGGGCSIWCWDLHKLVCRCSPLCVVFRRSKVDFWLGGVLYWDPHKLGV